MAKHKPSKMKTFKNVPKRIRGQKIGVYMQRKIQKQGTVVTEENIKNQYIKGHLKENYTRPILRKIRKR